MKRKFCRYGTLKELSPDEYYAGDWHRIGFDYDDTGLDCDIVFSLSRHEYRFVCGRVDD